VKITLDTETDHYDDVVEVLNAAFGIEWEESEPRTPVGTTDGGAAVDGDDESAVILGGWNAKKLRLWCSWLRDDAKEIVRYLAANPPGVHFDDVREHMGKYWELPGPASGQVVGGCMSSGGHAAAGIPGVKGQPIDRDYSRRRYVVDPRIAEILADSLGPPTV
jgi:hypothetical protein